MWPDNNLTTMDPTEGHLRAARAVPIPKKYGIRTRIQWRADAIYARKICAAAGDFTVNLINFW